MDRRTLSTAGLAAFLALDVVLVLFALRSTAEVPPSGPGAATPPATSAPSASPSASPPPSASPSKTAADVQPSRRIVVAVDRDVVWGLDVGSCGEPSSIHMSADGGETWSTEDAPGALTRLRPVDAASAFGVGGDDACAIRLWETTDGGGSWSDARTAAAAWGRDPEDATLFHRPGGDPVTPCPDSARVVDIAGLADGVASVVCDDGTLRETTDGGDTWKTALTREGLSAVSLDGPGSGVLAVVDGSCDGLVLVGLVRGNADGAGTCVPEAAPAAGRVSVSVGDRAVWLVAGDDLFRADSDVAGLSVAEVAPVGAWPRS